MDRNERKYETEETLEASKRDREERSVDRYIGNDTSDRSLNKVIRNNPCRYVHTGYGTESKFWTPTRVGMFSFSSLGFGFFFGGRGIANF